MERFAQYLDDVDDLVGALRLMGGTLRRLLFALLGLALVIALPAAGVLLALQHRPLAMAMATLLFVTLLYREATGLHSVRQQDV